jgi:hypothetical protein
MAGSGSGTGAVTPEANIALQLTDLRTYIWDQVAENDLLNAQEFDNDMLTHARKSVVDRWNGEPPCRTTYDVTTFPEEWIYAWKRGAAAEALRMAAFRYKRNELPYSAGGVSINDKAKAEGYLAIADREEAYFMSWMHRMKLMRDAQFAFWKLG